MGQQEFQRLVIARLIQEGADHLLSYHDILVVNMAWKQAVGPADCACQIIANRADCEDLDEAIDEDLSDDA